MKYVQVLNGNWVKVDDISMISHELSNDSETYLSYVTLRSGSVHDFMEIPDQFELDDVIYRFDGTCIMKYHELAAYWLACEESKSTMTVDELELICWEEFIKWANRNKDNLIKRKMD